MWTRWCCARRASAASRAEFQLQQCWRRWRLRCARLCWPAGLAGWFDSWLAALAGWLRIAPLQPLCEFSAFFLHRTHTRTRTALPLPSYSPHPTLHRTHAIHCPWDESAPPLFCRSPPRGPTLFPAPCCFGAAVPLATHCNCRGGEEQQQHSCAAAGGVILCRWRPGHCGFTGWPVVRMPAGSRRSAAAAAAV